MVRLPENYLEGSTVCFVSNVWESLILDKRSRASYHDWHTVGKMNANCKRVHYSNKTDLGVLLNCAITGQSYTFLLLAYAYLNNKKVQGVIKYNVLFMYLSDVSC